ncbi:MAG: redoxin domain-containing protein [Gemmatimonadota bacterium]|nr:redoxin domain-containing protein [Gemmatimonadota bacterium]MDE3172287.1 redoxin domain-containing protein [Gemmatimonadota bacterium]MDE3215834.1 redoxin domain-containing protein [Gemmatimonadota bacterium]
MTRRAVPLFALAFGLAAAATAGAQQPAPPPDHSPQVGTMAPDFTIPGATRFGVLAQPVHLADLRGKTVVLAFFIRARTKG